MSVDKATVANIAHLARIDVDDDELEPLAADLSSILQWIEQLNEVDTDNVPPMAAVHDDVLRWRADVVNDGNKQDDIVAIRRRRPESVHAASRQSISVDQLLEQITCVVEQLAGRRPDLRIVEDPRILSLEFPRQEKG